MWTWPLDSAMGATAAHRTLERVADGTYTQVWVWMTNKYRKRMNQGEGYIYIYIYITSEISQMRGGKCSWEARGVGNSHSWTRSPFPWDVGPFDSVFLAPIWSSPVPKQAVTPFSPTFGPILYKFIVISPLGLDPICHWAQSENCDPTVT